MLIERGHHTGDEYSGCPAWGYHRSEGSAYAVGDEEKCTCGFADTVAALRTVLEKMEKEC